ncbi:UNVERIFIED_CONTAM: hypothetical protein DES50_101692 [Williamsia faeni]
MLALGVESIEELDQRMVMMNECGLSRLSPSSTLECMGGGGRVPLGFLSDWFTFAHTPPEQYRGPKVTLVHPGSDRWTPPEISERFCERIAGPTQLVRLENCGHYPVEEPGLAKLEAAARSVIDAVVA